MFVVDVLEHHMRTWNQTIFLFLILSHRLVASLILQPPPCCLVDSSTTALLPLLFCIRKRFVFNIYDLHKFKSVNRKKGVQGKTGHLTKMDWEE